MSTLNVIRRLKNQKLNTNNNIILPSININNSNIVSQKYDDNDNENDNIKKRKKPKFKKINKTCNFDKIVITKDSKKDSNKNSKKVSSVTEVNEIEEDCAYNTYNTSNNLNTLQVFDLNKLKKFVEQIKDNNITDEEDLKLFYDDMDTTFSEPLQTIYE